MNLELLESFGQNYPEEFDGTLDCISLAVTCAFNRRGTLLAVGCNDGRIVLWDFLTRGIAKIISAHVHPVCSLCWTRDGYKLLSASTDNNVAIWDVLTGECDHKFRFPSPVLKAQFNPRKNDMFLVCPLKHPPVLVKIDAKHEIVPQEDESDMNVVASFDRRGNYIYTGNAKGKVMILTCPDLKVQASFRVTTGTSNAAAVKSIEVAKKGNCFLVNTADRVIRLYNQADVLKCGRDGEPEPCQKLQDLVNKTMWKKCCFSGDSEYICAGSARQHALYIWERSIGNLVKILHGTKGELLLDVVWHPLRPIVASISSGVVSIWAQNQVENWSAFAPDFKELDENVEYEERESEFDIEDEDKSIELNPEKEVDDELVDVVSYEPLAQLCSSDEEDEKDDSKNLLFLPIAPDVDETDDTWANEEDTGKRPSDHKENAAPSKKKRTKSHEIDLQGATDEPHPLLLVQKKDKTLFGNPSTSSAGKKGSGGPPAGRGVQKGGAPKQDSRYSGSQKNRAKDSKGRRSKDYY